MSDNALCSLLPWDSEFFDRRIGTVNADGLDATTVHAARRWAEENQIDCLYFLARDNAPTSLQAAQSAGFFYVDLRLELETSLVAAPVSTEGNEPAIRRATRDDLPALEALARASHRDTRFFRDLNFPRDRAEALYARWIARDWDTHEVLVVPAGADVAGYISVQAEGDQGAIGLLAVAAAHAGRGLGRALVASALARMHARGCRAARVVTQGDNIAAQRVYHAAGFRAAAAAPRFHLWCKRENLRPAGLRFPD